jgi:D-3-phosphoglycerate dehydrogenase
MQEFQIGITRDVLTAEGKPLHDDIGLRLLDAHPGVRWEVLPELVEELTPEHASVYDGILVLRARVSPVTVQGDPRLAIIARFGVGYDKVDVDACTRAGVAVTITPDGVRRPMASGILALVLALALRIKERDRLARENRWPERTMYLGTGLGGRTLGIVGLGNIGRDFSRLAAPLEMVHFAFDPYASEHDAAACGATLVPLEELLQRSDFVCLCCMLTDETFHLIDAAALARMKPTAYLVNVARGPVVDEPALTRALLNNALAGAALDVFDQEPPSPESPLLGLDNVIVTPHCIGHTDELVRLSGHSACRALLAVADGNVPSHLVNPAVLESERFRRRLDGTIGAQPR